MNNPGAIVRGYLSLSQFIEDKKEEYGDDEYMDVFLAELFVLREKLPEEIYINICEEYKPLGIVCIEDYKILFPYSVFHEEDGCIWENGIKKVATSIAVKEIILGD